MPAEKGYFLTELPYVLPLFLTFSRKKSQLDAVPAHFYFFSIFSKLSGIWRGTNALRRCPTLQGPGHDIADFGVIWGLLSIKNRFFSFSISIKSGLVVVWTHFRSIFFFADSFFPLGWAGPKIT